jgi:hypothetical protein
MRSVISNVMIPDSQMAREVTEFIRDAEGDMLFRHSMRVYLWGALHGQSHALEFDPELLYVAALFHDFGLTAGFHESPLRFEVDGANAARDFLRGHNIPEVDVRRTWLAIALHTTPGVPEHLEPEVALVHAGAAMDVVGRGYEEFRIEQRDAILAAYPRGHEFENLMIDAFYEGMKLRPQTTYGTFNDDYLAFKDPTFRRLDVCSVILNSPWRKRA